MKLWTIFRFELTYQVRRVSTWLYFVALVFFAFVQTVSNFLPEARSGGYFINGPLVVAYVTVIGCLVWLVVAAYVSGDLAARDAEARMDPLTYTAPVSKTEYLGGRFLAAFVLNAFILLAIPAGILIGVYAPELEAGIRGPFRPAIYLTAYAFIALPNAFVTTAIQFSFAALGRRAITSFLGGMILLFAATGWVFLAEDFGFWAVARMLDPTGLVILGELSMVWTPIQKNTLLIGLEGTLLVNRLLWLSVALGTLAFTHHRFRFGHHAATTWWSRVVRRRVAPSPTLVNTTPLASTTFSLPRVPRAFRFPTYVRQTFAIARNSFGSIVKSRSGFLLLSVVALFALVSVDPGFMGVPLLPRTDYVLHNLTSPEAPPAHFIIPLLIVFCSGTLAWREREVGLDELVDATPSPEWVFFLGKFLGFVMVLALCVGFRMVAGLLAQVGRGYYDFELGRYLQVLFGIQLADYLLLALLALLVHVVVNHKQISHLMVVLTMVVIIAAHGNEIGHELLVYGSDPGWTFTEMRGFGPSLVPWLWFKFYWAAWALLLGVVATLLWVRGTEEHTMARLRLVRNRLTRSKTGVAVGAGGLILASGAFIFHNTSTLIEYTTASDGMERRAEYERRYGQYDGAPQPRLMAVNLNVEIYPERRAVDIRGTYRMVNSTPVPIDSFHLATEVAPRAVAFDRSVSLVIGDEELGHRTYALDEPLQPGDSLRLTFEMQIEQQGFRDRGVASAVAKNGTYFRNLDWLPAIGYQPNRELNNAGQRQANGLAPRRTIPSLDDIAARQEAFLLQVGEGGIADAGLISFEAVVGTDETQTAIAPGALQQTWIEGGRRYFRYSTDPPIGNEYALFSAEYDVYEGQWNDVSIQIFHHPTHTGNLIRMVRSVQASLGHYTEQFGPYPYDHIRIVEHPGLGMGMHAEATTIDHEEGFTLLNPREDSLIIDLPFYVVAHEVAHQWWGSQTRNARVEGAGLLVESLASYSAYQVVESTYGTEHLRRIMRQLRRAYQVPRTRAAAPLLWANDPFLTYRKGPFALYALSRYVGEERVNGALRRMLETHRSGTPPLLSSLDLYRHLQAVTPDSLQYLLQDLFETNTYWDLETERAQAKQTEGGSWQVTLDVRARKVVVDSTGVETAVPMDDLVEIGVFASGGGDETLGAPLYIQMHRIRSGQQTVTVTVPTQPARAGIDPYHLLIDLAMGDNIEEVESFIRGDALHRGL